MRCTEPTKTRFFTVHEANAALLTIWKTSRAGCAKMPLGMYLCPGWDGDQGHFHLTSESADEAAAKARRKPPTRYVITDGAVPKPRVPKRSRQRGRAA